MHMCMCMHMHMCMRMHMHMCMRMCMHALRRAGAALPAPTPRAYSAVHRAEHFTSYDPLGSYVFCGLTFSL
jgi:hypothetical protein